MNVTTTSVLSPAVLESFSHRILPSPESELIYNFPASAMRMPAGGGTTLVMRRMDNLEAALVPLGNSGESPPPQQLQATDISATISFYGTYIYINEQVVLQNQEDVLAQAFLRLSYCAAITEDTLIRNMLASTASSVNCVGGVNGDNPSEITSSDLNDLEAAMLSNNGRKFTPSVMGSDFYGSAPIRAAYFLLSSTDVVPNYNNLTDFVPIARYSQNSFVHVAEHGSIGAFRVMVSSNGSSSSNASNLGATVYNNIAVAWDGYGIVKMDEYNLQCVYRPPIYVSPLAQNAEIGWKAALVPKIKNDAWVVNLKSTAPA